MRLAVQNPQLAPLANYGGPTQTMPPIPGSPAIDGCTNGTGFLFDQRGIGFPRVVGAYADIGAVEAISYYLYGGNGDASFGGAIGQGRLLLSDDGTNITGVMTKGPGNFNDTLVLYIDSTNGGFTNTAGFLDNKDGSRAAISGFGGSVVGTLTFATGFLPDYAIALGPYDNNYGGLWQLANSDDPSLDSGSSNLIFIASVNLNPIGTATSPTYSFSFNVGQIGVQTNSGATIKIFGTYISTPGFRSSETLLGTDVSGPDGYSFTQTSYATYTIKLAAVPPQLNGLTIMGGGHGPFQFTFTNNGGLGFTVWASTNLALPFNQWSNLGVPVESPAGTYTFTDPQATNNEMRFYRVSSP